jgi:hypothetical protein
MIRRELPLTVIANPAEPVAEAERGFSFVLARAAAGSVFEMASQRPKLSYPRALDAAPSQLAGRADLPRACPWHRLPELPRDGVGCAAEVPCKPSCRREFITSAPFVNPENRKPVNRP